MKEVPIYGKNGQCAVAKVDDCDFELASSYRWNLRRTKGSGRDYVYAYAKRRPSGLWMHRLIAKTPDGMVTDHVNHDTLDNRRSNLRPCTFSQNSFNRVLRSDSTTGERCLYFDKSRGRWRVVVKANGKRFRKWFSSIEVAREERDRKILEMHGEFANPALPFTNP